MKLRKLIINSLLCFISIYLPLISLSVFNYYLSPKRKLSSAQKKRMISELKVKNSSLDRGYFPDLTFDFAQHRSNIPIFPIGSLPFQKTYECDEGYGLTLYKTDRFGKRNDDKKWNDIYIQSNIFLIGDSFVHGACVPNENIISNQLEALSNTNTINLGSSGGSPYNYLAILKSFIEPIIKQAKTIKNHNNKVILVFYSNDNIIRKKQEPLLEFAKSIVNNSLDQSVKPSDEYLNNLTKLFEYKYSKNIKKINEKKLKKLSNEPFYLPLKKIIFLEPVGDLVKILSKRIIHKIYTDNVYKRSINLLSEICTDSCKPFVAYIPNSSFWEPDIEAYEFKAKLKNFTELKGLIFIDGEKVIDSNKKSDFAPNGGHLSIEGYKKFTNLLNDSI